MLTADVAAFRRFNRMYTRVIGTLDEGLLGTGFSLAEGRVIYELATRAEPNAKEIAESLGMDSGYLSRLLAKLESAALVNRKPSTRDSRRSDIVLTRQGKSAFAKLNSLSEKQAAKILEELVVADRSRLIQSMKTIEHVLVKTGNSEPPFVLRSHRPGDMGWVVSREGAIYAEEYGFDSSFEALVASIVADFLTNFDPQRERCWIAEMEGHPVGHIFLMRHPKSSTTAKLRLFLVESNVRGKGLGHALVGECIQFARKAGYRKITLWTQSELHAAQHIYKTAGFHLMKEEPHHSFGRDLVGQTWDLKL
jgi:DNA-binding MarR family transcriptional regulator/GNAT superfamily N-acetyltransferase